MGLDEFVTDGPSTVPPVTTTPEPLPRPPQAGASSDRL